MSTSSDLFKNLNFLLIPSTENDLSSAEKIIELLRLHNCRSCRVYDARKIDKHFLSQKDMKSWFIETYGASDVLHFIISEDTEFPFYNIAAFDFLIPVVSLNWVNMCITTGKHVRTCTFSPDKHHIFKNFQIYLSRDAFSKPELLFYTEMVHALGGTCVEVLSNRTTHLISTNENDNGIRAVLNFGKSYLMKFVFPTWIVQSFKELKAVPEQDHEIILTDTDEGTKERMQDLWTTVSDTPFSNTSFCMKGHSFILGMDLFLNKETYAFLIDFINANNGTVIRHLDESDIQSKGADIYIGSTNKSKEYEVASGQSMHLGNIIWLFQTWSLNSFVDPSTKSLYGPFKSKIFDASQLVLTYSNYFGQQRIYIQRLAEMLGGHSTPELSKKNTHLITQFPFGKKVDTARKWGNTCTIVNHLWLEECYNKENKMDPMETIFQEFPPQGGLKNNPSQLIESRDQKLDACSFKEISAKIDANEITTKGVTGSATSTTPGNTIQRSLKHASSGQDQKFDEDVVKLKPSLKNNLVMDDEENNLLEDNHPSELQSNSVFPSSPVQYLQTDTENNAQETITCEMETQGTKSEENARETDERDNNANEKDTTPKSQSENKNIVVEKGQSCISVNDENDVNISHDLIKTVIEVENDLKIPMKESTDDILLEKPSVPFVHPPGILEIPHGSQKSNHIDSKTPHSSQNKSIRLTRSSCRSLSPENVLDQPASRFQTPAKTQESSPSQITSSGNRRAAKAKAQQRLHEDIESLNLFQRNSKRKKTGDLLPEELTAIEKRKEIEGEARQILHAFLQKEGTLNGEEKNIEIEDLPRKHLYQINAICTGTQNSVNELDLEILRMIGIVIYDEITPDNINRLNAIIAPKQMRTAKFLIGFSFHPLKYIIRPEFIDDLLKTIHQNKGRKIKIPLGTEKYVIPGLDQKLIFKQTSLSTKIFQRANLSKINLINDIPGGVDVITSILKAHGIKEVNIVPSTQMSKLTKGSFLSNDVEQKESVKNNNKICPNYVFIVTKSAQVKQFRKLFKGSKEIMLAVEWNWCIASIFELDVNYEDHQHIVYQSGL